MSVLLRVDGEIKYDAYVAGGGAEGTWPVPNCTEHAVEDTAEVSAKLLVVTIKRIFTQRAVERMMYEAAWCHGTNRTGTKLDARRRSKKDRLLHTAIDVIHSRPCCRDSSTQSHFVCN